MYLTAKPLTGSLIQLLTLINILSRL